MNETVAVRPLFPAGPARPGAPAPAATAAEIPLSASGRHDAELQWICREVLGRFHPCFRDVPIHAAFFPYLGLTHTIRRRGPGWSLRLSDHCRWAPREVLEAIVVILAAKVLRRRPPARMTDLYNRFRETPSMESAVRARRRKSGRKRLGRPEGKHHSLGEILDGVNARFFDGRVEISRIGWSARRSWGRLGHFDPIHRTITISPVLDSERVPGPVIAFLVYHEMLHALFEEDAPGRRRHHPPEFQRTERAHPDYALARKFLARYCRLRGRSGG
jgi:hypothetical protein